MIALYLAILVWLCVGWVSTILIGITYNYSHILDSKITLVLSTLSGPVYLLYLLHKEKSHE